MSFAQTLSAYFFKDHPKQLFVGAELCARWCQLVKGGEASLPVERVISYAQGAQGGFSWIFAGEGITNWVGRVYEKKWDAQTVSALTDSISQSASCVAVVNDFFEFKAPSQDQLKVVGFAADTLTDVSELKLFISVLSKKAFVEKVVTLARLVSSLFLTFVSITVYYFGAQNYILPTVSLVLETTLFITKLQEYLLKEDV
jgi:hypothetical protein